mgnify:FL=1
MNSLIIPSIKRGLLLITINVLAIFIIGCRSNINSGLIDSETNQDYTSQEENIDNSAHYNVDEASVNNETSILTIDKEADYLLLLDDTSSYEISDILYGLFFEDINHAVDGGIYAEMIKNRSFEYDKMARNNHLHGWSLIDDITYEIIDGSQDESWLNMNNPHYIRLRNDGNSLKGISNEGFLSGISIKEGDIYNYSFYLKSQNGYEGNITVQFSDNEGNTYGKSITRLTDYDSKKNSWWKYEGQIKATASLNKGIHFSLLIENGTVDIDMISLFPQDTYLNRANGLRADLAKALEDLSPAFIRFPGGCVVEGETLHNAYDWKDSIGNGIPFVINGITTYGDVATRPLGENIWGNQNAQSKHPYYMTYGLGFYEYFQLCEDLGAEPIPIVNVGMSCQIQGTKRVGTPAQALEIGSQEFNQYIQDALDLVEFCKGDGSTRWGAIRIAMGHEKPFALSYIGIGNEQWGNEYFTRYEAFKNAFEQAAMDNPDIYGDIELIVSNGPVAADRYAWNKIKLYGEDYAGLVDEHYYMEPLWFLSNTNRYDSYDRSSTPVFLGEYAARSNNAEAALAEAAYMTGIERNGDIVKLASYAPLFGNGTSYQWNPDLIWFMNDSYWGSINYYVQKLFANNKSHTVIASSLKNNRTSEIDTSYDEVEEGLYEVSGKDEDGNFIVKIVNVSNEAKSIQIINNDRMLTDKKAKLSYLAAETIIDINNFLEPDKVTIKESTIDIKDNLTYTAPKYSVSVITIPR